VQKIAVIAGDGIGQEVMHEALRVLDAVASRYKIHLEYETFPWGCDYYLAEGIMMPEEGLEVLSRFDAILLGAVGQPGVEDHVSLWGLLIPIRREFQQYVNLRPVCLLEGVTSPLRNKGSEDIDFLVVRENNEGEYSNVGGRIYEGTEAEAAFQESIFTRSGVTRVMHFAFSLANSRKERHLTSATKSNGIIHTMPFWDEIFREISLDYPEVVADQYLVDALSARLVLAPEQFDVIVASNLFGDILSDLGPALAGSLGIAPSANLNPEREFPSMFEPVHGSAPDIAGQGIANPIGQIWSAAMMLEHLGHSEAAEAVEFSFRRTIANGVKTPDLGGCATTEEVGKAVANNVMEMNGPDH
jgi:tartrate dehydrogenase/decarboxylase/D-malate dehydrogenase